MVLSVGPVDGVGGVVRALPLIKPLVCGLVLCHMRGGGMLTPGHHWGGAGFANPAPSKPHPPACIEGGATLTPGPLDQSMAQAL